MAIILTVILLAAVHSIANPIHYLPFVALGKSRGWGMWRTGAVAVFCGTGHLVAFLATVLLGILIGGGISVFEEFLHWGESFGKYLFLAFGVFYTAYGIRRALRFKACGGCGNDPVCCECGHGHERFLTKTDPHSSKYIAFLFLMFVLGPCDAVLPLVLLPAADGDWSVVIVAGLAYYLTTVIIMGLSTIMLYKGLNLFKFKGKFIDRWSHAISGFVIALAALILLFGQHGHP